MKAIITKYHGPTNTRGSRISADDYDGNKVTVTLTHSSSDPHRDAAVALCRKMGWTGKMVSGGLGADNVFVFLPHDLILASKGRCSSDVLDLSMPDVEIAAFAKM